MILKKWFIHFKIIFTYLQDVIFFSPNNASFTFQLKYFFSLESNLNKIQVYYKEMYKLLLVELDLIINQIKDDEKKILKILQCLM